MNVRVITEYPWSNFFIKNMFLRLSEEELANFEEEWLVLCAPGYQPENPEEFGIIAGNFSILNFSQKIALVRFVHHKVYIVMYLVCAVFAETIILMCP